MDEHTEKYRVCPERNTTAAFRWFYQPSNALAFLIARLPAKPAPRGVMQPHGAPRRGA